MSTTAPLTLRERAQKLVELPWFQWSIIVVIVLNAIALGVDTSPKLIEGHEAYVVLFDHMVLTVFLIEISLRIFAHGRSFFRDPWSLFDLTIIVIAFLPHSEVFGVLRVLRILRLLRLITLVPSLKVVVEGLLSALPGMGAVSALLAIFMYIGAVIVTKIFGAAAPEQFGYLGISIFSLLQVTTLDGWPDMARAAMKTAPYAWIFFVFFIVLTTFTVLNLFVGVMVSAMEERVAHEKELKEAGKPKPPAPPEPATAVEMGQMVAAIQALQAELRELKAQMQKP